MESKNKKEPVKTNSSNSKSNITQLDDYRNNKKVEIRHMGFIYSGIETTEAEARKDSLNWLKYLVLKSIYSEYVQEPLKDISRRIAS